MVLAMRKRLNFLSTLFHESAECTSKLPGLYWQPLGTFVVLLGLYAFWTAVILHLATASKLSTILKFFNWTLIISFKPTDYPGIKSLKLVTPFVDHNTTSNDSLIADVVQKNLASIKGEYILVYVSNC